MRSEFLENLLNRFPHKLWKLLAGAIIGAIFTLGVVAKESNFPLEKRLAFGLGGAATGFVAVLFLLSVDAAQQRREARHEPKLTLGERLLKVCLVVGFSLAAISLLSFVLMLFVRAYQFIRNAFH